MLLVEGSRASGEISEISEIFEMFELSQRSGEIEMPEVNDVDVTTCWIFSHE